MIYSIYLLELSAIESEKVEWKKNGDNKNVVKSIIKIITVFANDIANMCGGYVKDFGFPKVIYKWLSFGKLSATCIFLAHPRAIKLLRK
ncbi:MAG: hypothetical protein LBS55_11960 [Prevotellaceae bacterium]|jgi:hypothetical protein|nr:hypothetical protein [Prevotellaceae bacterium]